MFKFTIRELLLITVIVALALGWLVNGIQLTNALHEARNMAAERKTDAQAWEETATALAAEMRKAGWLADVHRGRYSLQWPTLEAYSGALERNSPPLDGKRP